MLLLHTTGTSRIGDIYRYTITYTPSNDRILPPPSALHLRIKNTASLPLRAAYLHGPYTLYVSVRRQEFEPWSSDTPGTEGRKEELGQEEDRDPVFVGEGGIPVIHVNPPGTFSFEPQLKAGSSFYATLPIPSDLIEGAHPAVRQEHEITHITSTSTHTGFEHGGQRSLGNSRSFANVVAKPQRTSVTWIVEVISQTIFSATATVGFEVMLGRDEKSLSYSALSVLQSETAGSIDSDQSDSGIFSRALKVKTQNTHDLWNIPPFPSWSKEEDDDWRMQNGEYLDPEEQDEAGERRQGKRKKRKTKKVHLVILTHGLHSNTGADMLFMKEAIDEEARKGDIAWRERRRKERAASGKQVQTDSEVEDEEEDREQVIVRGFHENVCRTERGIKYLGRRLARYILHLVHPSTSPPPPSGPNKLHKQRPTHHHPHLTLFASLADHDSDSDVPPYKITSISFIGHSLGGLVQTYAIAYIHAHSPNFFTDITPVSFVALATPFLGLSNENPMYVKFALDFGLVGRTGQDLGLTWRAPSAFSAFTAKPAAAARPTDTSKPLLRILPTGPAHGVLKKFRNRTVYANVVNDGIVPLRTSCLLFLDWKGLGKVEKARRENSAVQGLVGWGWGQLTNGSTSPRGSLYSPTMTKTKPAGSGSTSPVSPAFQNKGKTGIPAGAKSPLITTSDSDVKDNQVTEAPLTSEPTRQGSVASSDASQKEQPPAKSSGTPNPLSSLLTLFRPNASSKSKGPESKSSKIYRRSQTTPIEDGSSSSKKSTKAKAVPSFPQPLDVDPVPSAPPRTTLLEAANHVLNPPLPSTEFLIDPSSRPRTIFHDRVYSSNDVPPPRSRSNTSDKDKDMKVEEKIARAYHWDLAWRKVLVRLEPDAHNNMIVRRMFANAYGWPVVRHVVETHFGESWSARTADEDEGKQDRATTPEEEAADGNEDGQQTPMPKPSKDTSLDLEKQLDLEREIASIRSRARSPTASSGAWSDRAFAITDDEDSDSEVEVRKEEEIGRFLGLQPRLQRPAIGDEMRYKSSSSMAGVSRVEVVVSPGGSGSGDLGDGPSAVWGDGTSSGLGLGEITRVGLGRWGSGGNISSGTRATGASLEAVRGSSGSDAVRLLERNISIAGPSRNGPKGGSRASSRSGDTERGFQSGRGSRTGSYTEEQIQGDLGERDAMLSLTRE